MIILDIYKVLKYADKNIEIFVVWFACIDRVYINDSYGSRKTIWKRICNGTHIWFVSNVGFMGGDDNFFNRLFGKNENI